jgi:acyl-CoA reductase-like NAD-dependent aldehyde dehydrogenase
LVVLDADLDAAAAAAASGVHARRPICMSTERIVVDKSVQDEPSPSSHSAPTR